jgi:hypothetical protein
MTNSAGSQRQDASKPPATAESDQRDPSMGGGWAVHTVRPWLISLTVHTLGLTFLALWVLPGLRASRIERLSASLTPNQDIPAFSLAAPTSNPNSLAETSDDDAPVSIQEWQARVVKIEPIPLQRLARSAIRPAKRAEFDATAAPAQRVSETATSREASELSEIRHSDGVGGAADIVTGAIRGELSKGDTLVVWLLDASISLSENREALANKTSAFYKSIDSFNTSRDDYSGEHTLMSSVVAFGRRWSEVLRPTRMGAKAVDAMIDVPIDTSGVENVMAAVNRTVRLYRGSRHWDDRLVLIVLTDESGDDVLQLESTIELCNEANVAVHVIGPSAVMGCQKGSQHCVLKKNNVNYSFWLTVNKGPETSLPERFLLPYWHESSLPPWQQDGASAGHSAWYGGAYRERLPSGFGPYALTRLALQTGGSFTMFERLPMQARYQVDAMRQYVPDYGSLQEYVASMEDRPLRRFVSDSAEIGFRQPDLFLPPRLTFMGGRSPHYPYGVEHVYFSPADFRDRLGMTLSLQRKRVTRASRVLAGMIEHLVDSSIDWEYEYTKDESKRWRAWYDLTKGRLLATQARYLEYLATINEIETVLSNSSNEVTLRPSSTLRNPASPLLVREATRVLYRCIEQNQETPWADLAQWELDTPFGLDIGQKSIPRPPPRIGGSARQPQQFSFPNL